MIVNDVKERRRLERERQKAQRERRKRLEAAAPALLAACKFVINHLNKLDSGLPDDDPINRLRRIAHKPLRDILEPAISLAGEE